LCCRTRRRPIRFGQQTISFHRKSPSTHRGRLRHARPSRRSHACTAPAYSSPKRWRQATRLTTLRGPTPSALAPALDATFTQPTGPSAFPYRDSPGRADLELLGLSSAAKASRLSGPVDARRPGTALRIGGGVCSRLPPFYPQNGRATASRGFRCQFRQGRRCCRVSARQVASPKWCKNVARFAERRVARPAQPRIRAGAGSGR